MRRRQCNCPAHIQLGRDRTALRETDVSFHPSKDARHVPVSKIPAGIVHTHWRAGLRDLQACAPAVETRAILCRFLEEHQPARVEAHQVAGKRVHAWMRVTERPEPGDYRPRCRPGRRLQRLVVAEHVHHHGSEHQDHHRPQPPVLVNSRFLGWCLSCP